MPGRVVSYGQSGCDNIGKKKKSSSKKKANAADQKTKRFYDMPVGQIMDQRIWDLPLIEKDDIALHVLAILSSSDHVWVVEDMESRELVGVITEHDILQIMSPTKRISFFGAHAKRPLQMELNETTEHIMQYHPVTCKREDTVKKVLRKMTTHGCRRIAVVDSDDSIVGEITLHQIISKVYTALKNVSAACAQEGEKHSGNKLKKRKALKKCIEEEYYGE